MRRSLVWTHRWTSIVLGLVLLAITTSGAILVYAPEIQRWTHPSVFQHHETTRPISFQQAIEEVNSTHPEFGAASINVQGGIIQVSSNDSDAHPGFYGVDPGTGEITGFVKDDGWFMRLMVNLHECGLTCEGYPGYMHWIASPVPWVATHVIPGAEWGAMILALMGILLLFLVISGVIVWWPGIKKWRIGFQLRRRNRYTRDFDLHKLIGLAALPFLFMWGLTGTSFELPVVNNVWYSLTGGQTPPADQYTFASKKVDGKPDDIGISAAVAAAVKTAHKEGIHGPVVNAFAPAKGTKADGYYSIYISRRVDPWAYGQYPGQVGIDVDRWDATHVKITADGHGATMSNRIWDDWRYGMFHYGYAVNGWWRSIWFLFGITPLVLAWTGMSTWLWKRGVARRKKLAKAAREAVESRDAATNPVTS